MDSAEVLNRVSENLSVGRAFGAGNEKDRLLTIPVALVAGGGSGGQGTAELAAGETAAPIGKPRVVRGAA